MMAANWAGQLTLCRVELQFLLNQRSDQNEQEQQVQACKPLGAFLLQEIQALSDSLIANLPTNIP